MNMTLDRAFITSKLDAISLYLKRLETILVSDAAAIRDDFLQLHALERLVQLIVDEMVDINTHIIRRTETPTPDDFQSTFMILASIDVFPREFAERIAPTVGLRNRLVHRYEAIDPTILIRMTKQESGDFKEYLRYILAWLDR